MRLGASGIANCWNRKRKGDRHEEILAAILARWWVASRLGVPAAAKTEYVALFEAAYPAATGSRISNCTLCHTASTPNRNSYGAAWRTASRSFTAINGDDSDGDGFTNLLEINAKTYPGNAADRPAPVDAAAPTVDAFDIPAASTSLTISILAFTASDDTGVTGFLPTETAATPAPGAAAGKISSSRSDTVVIAPPPRRATPSPRSAARRCLPGQRTSPATSPRA